MSKSACMWLGLGLALASAGTAAQTANNIPKYTSTGTFQPSTIWELNGNVGIGTTAPVGTLSVAADDTLREASGYSQFQIVGKTDSTKNFLMGLDTTNGFAYLQTLHLGTAWGVYPLVLQPFAGNVGIGTPSPGALLDVVGGDIRAIGPTYGFNLQIPSSWTGGWARGFVVTDSTNALLAAFGAAGSGTPSTTLTYAWIGTSYSSPWMTFRPSGNIGIGTTNPQSLLSVGSSSQFQVGSTGAITAPSVAVSGTVTAAGFSGSGLGLTGIPYSAITGAPAAGVTSVFGRAGAVTSASGDYSVNQITGAAPLASPVFSGNVGIGTTSPNGPLDVKGP